MITIISILISFFAGMATIAGVYFAYRQFRRNEATIELIDAHGSPFFEKSAEEEGYLWKFELVLLNRRNENYAITDIKFRPVRTSVRRALGMRTEKWLRIQFPDVFETVSAYNGIREPLVLKPYECKEIPGYLWNHWGDRKYIQETPEVRAQWEALFTALMNGHIEYLVLLGDGREHKYCFRHR